MGANVILLHPSKFCINRTTWRWDTAETNFKMASAFLCVQTIDFASCDHYQNRNSHL